jgi:pimeloyl-ACP methyl ester carboxylesterase
MTRTPLLAVLLVVATTGSPAFSQIQDGPVSPLASCDLPGVPPPVACGKVTVPENREDPDGRHIGLRIVHLGITGDGPPREPLFVLLGGPGSAATFAAAGLANQHATLREHHPIVLVDQRGTGGSHPIECSFYGPEVDLERLTGDLIPADRVRECARKLSKVADLTRYTTRNAVLDLDEVRRRLGYDRLLLHGISYGTLVALDFARLFPSHVAAMVLEGTVGPQHLGHERRAPVAQRALMAVLEDCLADDACRAAFPHLRADAEVMFARLDAGPVTVTVAHPESGEPVEVRMTRDLAGEAVRYLLYGGRTIPLVPLVVHQAAGGDFQPLAEFALFARRNIMDGGGNGLYLSVLCAEDYAAPDPHAAREAANGTFWSDNTFRQLMRACDFWPRGKMPDGFREPVASDAPTLFLSGDWDPATPPSNAREVAAGLPSSRQIIIPKAGHSADGMKNAGCVSEIMNAFLLNRDQENLDATCVGRMERGAFFTEPLAMRQIDLPEADVAALAGTYRMEGAPVEIGLEPDGSRFTLRLPGGGAIRFIPVAEGRFRAIGLLGFYLDVERAGPEAVRLLIDSTGAEAAVFVRE